MIQRLYNYVIVKPTSLLFITCILSVSGTLMVLAGGVWDASSHALKEPEMFWSIQHVAVYTGVSMIGSSAIVSGIMIAKNYLPKTIRKGPKTIIASSVILIVSGFGDSLSHDVFGIDGLLSWSHQPLEFGLVLASLGGFFLIKSHDMPRLRFLGPLSIGTVLLSASWLGFNLFLLIGATIMCIPIYQIFSSGCAIL